MKKKKIVCSKQIVPADLIMKVSDLELMVKVLKELNVEEFNVVHVGGSDRENPDHSFNKLEFQFFNEETLSFVVMKEIHGNAFIFYEGHSKGFEDILDERRTVKSYFKHPSAENYDEVEHFIDRREQQLFCRKENIKKSKKKGSV